MFRGERVIRFSKLIFMLKRKPLGFPNGRKRQETPQVSRFCEECDIVDGFVNFGKNKSGRTGSCSEKFQGTICNIPDFLGPMSVKASIKDEGVCSQTSW